MFYIFKRPNNIIPIQISNFASFGISNLHSTRTKATFMKNKGDRYPVCPFVSISCMFYWTVNWGLKSVGHSVQMLTRSDRSRTVHGSLAVDKNTFNWILRKWGWNFFVIFLLCMAEKQTYRIAEWIQWKPNTPVFYFTNILLATFVEKIISPQKY